VRAPSGRRATWGWGGSACPSLVGPRPPITYETERYQSWHVRRLQEVRPGITGLWRVEGRGKTKFDDMVRLDLRHIRNWSLWLDIKIKILLKTLAVVFRCDGADWRGRWVGCALR
jgi:lipopolysaccharide/colanic/teichoic acid biosynthesis glycosyltransferase